MLRMFGEDAQIMLALTTGACALFLTVLTMVWTCWTIYRLDRTIALLLVGRDHYPGSSVLRDTDSGPLGFRPDPTAADRR